jgi:hypothetical protein
MDNKTRPFGSIGELLRTTRVTTRDGRSFVTRPHLHGAVRVTEEGAYLIALLVNWETPGRYESRLSPGLYRVVTLHGVEVGASGADPVASCVFREDATAVRWEWPPEGFGTDTRSVALITRGALARWADLIEQEEATRRRKGWNKVTSADFPVWNATCDLFTSLGPPDPFLGELGFCFNDPEGGDGVCFSSEIATYLHWGLDASGSRVAMLCAWEDIVEALPAPGTGVE